MLYHAERAAQRCETGCQLVAYMFIRERVYAWMVTHQLPGYSTRSKGINVPQGRPYLSSRCVFGGLWVEGILELLPR